MSQLSQNALFYTVRDRRKQMEKSPFITNLADTTVNVEARLSYVPHMLFFIMGFKDMLQVLNIDSSDEIQQHVNEHCQEDNGHWKWFLRDLETIKLKENFYHQSNTKLCSEMWSDENMAIRQMVYKAMVYCYMAETPAQRMVILEVIEAIFSVFVENMNILVNQMGKYDEYLFFGRVHHQAESGHSNGSWLDGDKKHIEVEAAMSAHEKEMALVIINGLFDSWDQMAARWNEQQQYYLKSLLSYA